MSSEYDRKAAAWVRKHYPDAQPMTGSVEFGMDAAAYTSSAWAKFEVTWLEQHNRGIGPSPDIRPVTKTIEDSAWQYDATALLRELVEMEDPGE